MQQEGPDLLSAPRFAIREIALFERAIPFRKPFRFGSVTVEAAREAHVRVTIELEEGGVFTGATAELMVPKWFDKNPDLTADETVSQLRKSLVGARYQYLASPEFDTAFGHHHRVQRVMRFRPSQMSALAVNYGPAEIDKALLDAVLKARGMDVFAGLRRNVMGLDTRLTPDLDAEALPFFLLDRVAPARIALRHTVGMLDPIEGPVGLVAIARAQGLRLFKIKLSGEEDADRERLSAIARALDHAEIDWQASLDANEQYFDLDSLARVLGEIAPQGRLSRYVGRVLHIEQPLPRETTRTTPLGELAQRFSLTIDEADDGYDAFAAARAMGYRGVSSKSCKGIYKSILNAARAAAWTAESPERPFFITGEDLTCQSGLALQQDSALAAFIGITQAERNGHHYAAPFAASPRAEREAFLDAFPGFYRREEDGSVSLKLEDGAIRIGPLAVPHGFASGVEVPTEGMTQVK